MEILRKQLGLWGFTCCVLAVLSPHALASPTLKWVRQIGTQEYDFGHSVAGDQFGNVFVHGSTRGNLGGPHSGVQFQRDLFITKLNVHGDVQWARQFSDPANEARSTTTDSLGNVIVATSTTASRGGQSAGGYDAVMYKLDQSGAPVWTRQLGTGASDEGVAVAIDSTGNVLLAGNTHGNLGGSSSGNSDAFLANYDAPGVRTWVRQFGSPGLERVFTASADGFGGYYVAGMAEGNLGGPAIGDNSGFVRKYDSGGNVLWTRHMGPTSYGGLEVSADKLGNVFVLGNTIPNQGKQNAFVARYDTAGNHIWTRQITSGTMDAGLDIWADGLGNVLVAGDTEGNLGGFNAGMSDAFVTKLDSDGEVVWNYQLGAIGEDRAEGIWADSRGNILVTGYTEGYLEGSVETLNDAWVALLREDILQGDFNRDGIVNAADYVVWRKGFATGIRTQDEYNTWRSNFGAPTAGAAAGTLSPSHSAVPEPSALALAVFALAAIGRSCSRGAKNGASFTPGTATESNCDTRSNRSSPSGDASRCENLLRRVDPLHNQYLSALERNWQRAARRHVSLRSIK